MATAESVNNQYLAGNYVMAAGSVLFRTSPDTGKLEICLLYTGPSTKKWQLPKGRQDIGEKIEATAVRETFEETGYPCELLPLRMPTRAPVPGNNKDLVKVVDGLTEPVAVTVRHLGKKGLKLIMWYVTRLKAGAVKEEGTLETWETFESQFVDADEAVRRLTSDGNNETDRDVAAKALELVVTMCASGRDII